MIDVGLDWAAFIILCFFCRVLLHCAFFFIFPLSLGWKEEERLSLDDSTTELIQLPNYVECWPSNDAICWVRACRTDVTSNSCGEIPWGGRG